jgi:hypothetical protein
VVNVKSTDLPIRSKQQYVLKPRKIKYRGSHFSFTKEAITIQRVTKVMLARERWKVILIKIPFRFNFHTSVVGHVLLQLGQTSSAVSGGVG